MIRTVKELVLAFDCEWVPDPIAGRLLFDDLTEASDADVRQRLWAANGATPDNPTPFIRMVESRVVSIAMITRRKNGSSPAQLKLSWLPKLPNDPTSRSERSIISSFLGAIGKTKPQLVGYNSKGADLRILLQRALTLGVPCGSFLARGNKSWEGEDYFACDNDCHLDLMDLLCGTRPVPLNEFARISGIPGKMETSGLDVWRLWDEGKFDQIVQYNCFDAITTYLVWLRLAWIAGKFDSREYGEEQELLRQLLMELCDKPETAFLETYITEWDRLQAIHENYDHA